MTPQELYAEFLHIAETGDEETAHAFVMEHFSQFPEETQQELAFAYFEKAVSDKATALEEIDKLKEEGIEALSKLNATEGA